MRAYVSVKRPLKGSAAAVWQLVSSGREVERWFPWVAETVLGDAREGGSRVIRMHDGSSFDEYITLNDERTRTYQYYAPDPPLAAKHVIGTQRIEGTADGECVTWSVTFDLAPGAPQNLTQTLRELYEGALQRIDALAQTP